MYLARGVSKIFVQGGAKQTSYTKLTTNKEISPLINVQLFDLLVQKEMIRANVLLSLGHNFSI